MSELASRASLAATAWTARLGFFCRPGLMTSVDNSWVTPVTTPDRPTVAVKREPMLRVHWVWVSALVVVLGLLYAWQLQPGIAPHGDISKFQFAGPVGGTRTRHNGVM